MFMYGFINRFCIFKSIRKFLGRMAACDNSFRHNFLSSYKWYLRSKSLFHGLVFEAITEWKMSKYGVISGPHFPAFGMNAGKYGPEITPYLDTFQEGEQILWIRVVGATTRTPYALDPRHKLNVQETFRGRPESKTTRRQSLV